MTTAAAAADDRDPDRRLRRRMGGHDADRIAAYHAEDGIFHLHSAAEAVAGARRSARPSPACSPCSPTSPSSSRS